MTSAYEVLERRFGVGPRMLGVAMFLALRLAWMGLMVHVAAEAVTAMLDLDKETAEQVLPLIVVACTAIGGLRAVVFTDVIQFWLLLGGAILTILFITSKIGFECFPTEWSDHWDEQKAFSFSPHERVAVVGTIFGVVLWWVATAGSDQTAV